jgi:Tol biopolymer transport system component
VFAALLVLAAGIGGGTGSARAATAPNGQIAYSSWDEDLNYDIYVVDPAAPEVPPVQLTTDGRYNGNPDWSPDGTKIAFDGWATFGGPRIQVMDTDPATDDPTVVSEPCPAPEADCYGDFQPAWSPDGTKIAFVSSRPNADGTENWSYEIYVTDATGEVGSLTSATRLTTDAMDEETGKSIEDSQVTWSPDGRRIAFLSTGRGLDEDSCDLWVMNSTDLDGDGFGDDLRQLTFDESFNCDAFEDVTPQWSPNSSLIALTSVRTGYFDIWLVNADDPSDLRNVTRTPDDAEDQPGWSPDGMQVIFRSAVSGSYELYSLPVPPPDAPVAGRVAPTPTQLTSDGTTKQQADWGPVRRRSGTFALEARKTGRGTVHSVRSGIACGRDCHETFVRGATVQLRAVAASGYRFKRWGGACAGRLSACSVRMTMRLTAIARFVPKS